MQNFFHFFLFSTPINFQGTMSLGSLRKVKDNRAQVPLLIRKKFESAWHHVHPATATVVHASEVHALKLIEADQCLLHSQ